MPRVSGKPIVLEKFKLDIACFRWSISDSMSADKTSNLSTELKVTGSA
ncbi:hypothetical protein [Bacillus sp. SH8-8]|nr:hypothetical protein [Bacillus sp. SH8-8]